MLRRQRSLKEDDRKGKNRWRDKAGRQRSAFSHTQLQSVAAPVWLEDWKRRKINDREAVIGWDR